MPFYRAQEIFLRISLLHNWNLCTNSICYCHCISNVFRPVVIYIKLFICFLMDFIFVRTSRYCRFYRQGKAAITKLTKSWKNVYMVNCNEKFLDSNNSLFVSRSPILIPSLISCFQLMMGWRRKTTEISLEIW